MIPYFDWIIGASMIASLFLLERKMWQGWILALLNNGVLFPVLNVHNRNFGLLPVDAVLVMLAAKAIYSWRKA